MTAKLSGLTDRFDEVAALLSDPESHGEPGSVHGSVQGVLPSSNR